MNKSKKNNKNFIIIGIALVIIVFCVIVYLLFSGSTKNKKEIVNCYYEVERVNVTQKVEYIDDKFSHLEFEQKLDFSGINLKVSLDELRESLKIKLEDQFKNLSNSAEYYVETDGATLVLGYNLNVDDYKKIENYLQELDETENSNDNFYDDKNRFINQVISQGGDCTYEE